MLTLLKDPLAWSCIEYGRNWLLQFDCAYVEASEEISFCFSQVERIETRHTKQH